MLFRHQLYTIIVIFHPGFVDTEYILPHLIAAIRAGQLGRGRARGRGRGAPARGFCFVCLCSLTSH